MQFKLSINGIRLAVLLAWHTEYLLLTLLIINFGKSLTISDCSHFHTKENRGYLASNEHIVIAEVRILSLLEVPKDEEQNNNALAFYCISHTRMCTYLKADEIEFRLIKDINLSH